MTKQEKTNLTDQKRFLIFLNIVITCISSSMLSTALTTALPAIVRDLAVDVSLGQWLTSGYSLAMGVMMPLTAFLITRFPTRRLYLAGLGIFLAGLVVCVSAKSFPVMMLARLLQASGGGILTAMSQVIILSIYPPEKRGTAMGWYGLSIGAAPVIAPTLAGIIVDNLSWQAIFYIAIAILLVSLAWAFFVFEDLLETGQKRFDLLSFALSAAAFSGVTLGIGNIGSQPFISAQVLGVLAVGLAAAVVFTVRQFRLEQPFLDLRILKSRRYTLSVLGSMVLYLVMMGASMLMPLYAQSVLGLSATVSGLIVLPGSLTMAFISPFAGRIYDKTGIRVLFIAGSLCMLASTLGMFFLRMETPVWAAALLNTLRNAAIGCLMMPLVTWGTGSVPPRLTAHATALLTSLRTVAGAIGTAVFVGIMTGVSRQAADSYGAAAGMHGLNIAFLCMGAATLVLLFLGIFCIPKQPSAPEEQPES